MTELVLLWTQYYKHAKNVSFVLKLFEKSKVIYAKLWLNVDFVQVKQNFEYSWHHHFGLGSYTNN